MLLDYSATDLFFEYLIKSCLSCGGDGTRVVYCEDWKLVGAAFNEYLIKNCDTYWTNEDSVVFSHDQESIEFKPPTTGTTSDLPNSHYSSLSFVTIQYS